MKWLLLGYNSQDREDTLERGNGKINLGQSIFSGRFPRLEFTRFMKYCTPGSSHLLRVCARIVVITVQEKLHPPSSVALC